MSAILLLSQNFGNGMDIMGLSQATGPYLLDQFGGIGNSKHVLLGDLSEVERGKQELWAGGQDTRNASNLLRKPWHFHLHGRKSVDRDPGGA